MIYKACICMLLYIDAGFYVRISDSKNKKRYKTSIQQVESTVFGRNTEKRNKYFLRLVFICELNG